MLMYSSQDTTTPAPTTKKAGRPATRKPGGLPKPVGNGGYGGGSRPHPAPPPPTTAYTTHVFPSDLFNAKGPQASYKSEPHSYRLQPDDN